MRADGLFAQQWVGIDWGTTHRRGYLMSAQGECLAKQQDAEGMLAARGRFAASLQTLLDTLGVSDPGVPVLMSGMVGSASGWVEVPYLPLDVALTQLSHHLVAVPGVKRHCLIVPGYVQQGHQGVDVMRGEETQLLGACCPGNGSDGWYVLPGTHSKWARLAGGKITEFATFMTGELFSLLGSHGTLAAASSRDGALVDEAFVLGLQAAPAAALSNALFSCRARVVSGLMPAGHARSYLSGLLIGAEWHDIRRRGAGVLPAQVRLIGSPELASYYARAGEYFGVTIEQIDPHTTYLRALRALRPVA